MPQAAPWAAPAPPRPPQGKLGSESPKSVTLAQRRKEFPQGRDMPTPDVRLYHRAVVVAQDVQGQMRGLVRQLSIDQFENESRRVSMGVSTGPEPSSVARKTPLFQRSFSEPVRGGVLTNGVVLQEQWRLSCWWCVLWW